MCLCICLDIKEQEKYFLQNKQKTKEMPVLSQITEPDGVRLVIYLLKTSSDKSATNREGKRLVFEPWIYIHVPFRNLNALVRELSRGFKDRISKTVKGIDNIFLVLVLR